MSLTFEQQMWDKWSDDDDERSWLIPEYKKEAIVHEKKIQTLGNEAMASELKSTNK